jgi:hypothetical protein
MLGTYSEKNGQELAYIYDLFKNKQKITIQSLTPKHQQKYQKLNLLFEINTGEFLLPGAIALNLDQLNHINGFQSCLSQASSSDLASLIIEEISQSHDISILENLIDSELEFLNYLTMYMRSGGCLSSQSLQYIQLETKSLARQFVSEFILRQPHDLVRLFLGEEKILLYRAKEPRLESAAHLFWMKVAFEELSEYINLNQLKLEECDSKAVVADYLQNGGCDTLACKIFSQDLYQSFIREYASDSDVYRQRLLNLIMAGLSNNNMPSYKNSLEPFRAVGFLFDEEDPAIFRKSLKTIAVAHSGSSYFKSYFLKVFSYHYNQIFTQALLDCDLLCLDLSTAGLKLDMKIVSQYINSVSLNQQQKLNALKTIYRCREQGGLDNQEASVLSALFKSPQDTTKLVREMQSLRHYIDVIQHRVEHLESEVDKLKTENQKSNQAAIQSI